MAISVERVKELVHSFREQVFDRCSALNIGASVSVSFVRAWDSQAPEEQQMDACILVELSSELPQGETLPNSYEEVRVFVSINPNIKGIKPRDISVHNVHFDVEEG